MRFLDAQVHWSKTLTRIDWQLHFWYCRRDLLNGLTDLGPSIHECIAEHPESTVSPDARLLQLDLGKVVFQSLGVLNGNVTVGDQFPPARYSLRAIVGYRVIETSSKLRVKRW